MIYPRRAACATAGRAPLCRRIAKTKDVVPKLKTTIPCTSEDVLLPGCFLQRLGSLASWLLFAVYLLSGWVSTLQNVQTLYLLAKDRKVGRVRVTSESSRGQVARLKLPFVWGKTQFQCLKAITSLKATCCQNREMQVEGIIDTIGPKGRTKVVSLTLEIETFRLAKRISCFVGWCTRPVETTPTSRGHRL